jgi:DNA-binding MurR/RpiR family transcriptional regulator
MLCNFAAMGEHTMTLAEIAAELQISPATLRRRWRKLHAEAGFPRPIAGFATRWSRPLVTAWLRAGGVQGPAPANDDAATGDAAAMIAAQRRALQEHYRSR